MTDVNFVTYIVNQIVTNCDCWEFHVGILLVDSLLWHFHTVSRLEVWNGCINGICHVKFATNHADISSVVICVCEDLHLGHTFNL